MPVLSPRATRETFPAACNASRVMQGRDESVYAFFGPSDATACESVAHGAPLSRFVDAFEEHCGLRPIEQTFIDAWVPRPISGGPNFAMAIPAQQVDNPRFQNCLNFEAMEIAYPRSEALRLGLCAGLPFGMLLAAWTVIGAVNYLQLGRRQRAQQPPPPVPPNTPELGPPRARTSEARGYGTCVALGDMSADAITPA